MATFFSFKKFFQGKLFAYSFLLTLPLYFILDNVNKFWGFVPFHISCTILLSISGVSTLSLLILCRFFRLSTSSLILIWFMFQYLFFKAIKERVVKIEMLSFFYQYKYFLPFLCVLSIVFFVILKKSYEVRKNRLISYFNLLFFTLAGIESTKAGYFLAEGRKAKSVTTEVVVFAGVESDTKMPDIYLLLMDEYQGTLTLKNHFGFSNEKFVNELKQRAFFIPSKPYSNYNLTPFSILSLLNMGYIKNYTEKDVYSGIAFNMCMKGIESNNVMNFFRSSGYTVINNSFFKVENSKNIRRLFLPTEERLLLDKTFGRVFINDLVPSLHSNDLHLFIKDGPAKTDWYNQRVIAKTKSDIKNSRNPVFLYAHFMMPHFPFLRDSTGKLRDIAKAYKESNKGRDPDTYISYIKYCNLVIIDIVDEIVKNDNNAVVIVASDHGLRHAPKGNTNTDVFNNLLAIRTPGNIYNDFTDSTSLVNVFRIILNNHFQQKLSLLEEHKITVSLSSPKKIK